MLVACLWLPIACAYCLMTTVLNWVSFNQINVPTQHCTDETKSIYIYIYMSMYAWPCVFPRVSLLIGAEQKHIHSIYIDICTRRKKERYLKAQCLLLRPVAYCLLHIDYWHLSLVGCPTTKWISQPKTLYIRSCGKQMSVYEWPCVLPKVSLLIRREGCVQPKAHHTQVVNEKASHYNLEPTKAAN